MSIKRRKNSHSYLKWPLIVANVYILSSIAISFWGPMKYINYNRLIVAIFMSSFLIVFNIGYATTIVRRINNAKSYKVEVVSSVGRRIAIACINISLIIVLYQLVVLIGTEQLNLSISQVGKEYIDFYSEFQRGVAKEYGLLQIVSFVTYLPKNIAVILGVYYYKELRIIDRIRIVALIAAMIIISFLGIGQQKPIGDIMIFILCILMIRMTEATDKGKRQLFMFALLIGVMFTMLLGFVQISRYDYIGINLENYVFRSYQNSYFDLNHIVFRIFGDRLGFGIASILSSYMSGGYYGLSLCLSLPFVWTYGLGSSYSFGMLMHRIIGIESQLTNTYPLRMEATYGWPGLTRWNTVFPWIASDFSFIGAILLFIPFAALYSVSWKEAVEFKNPISIVLFCMLTVGMIYIPANNQLFHSVESFVAISIIIPLWVHSHRRLNARRVS